MKLQLLPTTIDENRVASLRQHLCCLVIDDRVAIDAGSLGMAVNDVQRKQIRDVLITHAHLDHIAGLPIFIDDLFATLKTPIRIHATNEIIEALENHVFNWVLYPNVAELKNDYGNIISYQPIQVDRDFQVAHLNFTAVNVNHKVPTVGFIFSDAKTKIAMTGDTSEMDVFWGIVNSQPNLDVLLIECAFPDELSELANVSFHLTPNGLKNELKKFEQKDCQIYVINLKPMYRQQICEELKSLQIPNLNILEVGKVFEF